MGEGDGHEEMQEEEEESPIVDTNIEVETPEPTIKRWYDTNEAKLLSLWKTKRK